LDEVNRALQGIARGTGIIFFGTIISLIFGFITRVVVARHFLPSDYGIYAISLTILNIAVVIATVGIPAGLPREIAYNLEKDRKKVEQIKSSSFFLVLLTSIALFSLMFLGVGKIAEIFDEESLDYSLRLMAIALPFMSISGVIIAISRGFGRVKEQLYFQNLLNPFLFLSSVIVIVATSSQFITIFYAYVLAVTLTSLILLSYSLRIDVLKITLNIDLGVVKKLVVFSFPLFISSVLTFLVTWADTLMLGYFKNAEIVGIYNSAVPLAQLIPLFLNSAGYIYMPVASSLYARGKLAEMRRTYQILTKWIFLFTLPIFSIMFLFPEATISFFFGERYLWAGNALRILSLGFMFHSFVGMNGISLIVTGESNFILVSNIVVTGLNILLNILLIPIYGMEGAATATAVSYIAGNTLISSKLYRKTKIHPFSLNYIKPLLISFALLIMIQMLHLEITSIWFAIPILVVFLIVYFLLVLFSKSVDKEDVELFLEVERKLGIEMEIVKKILRRFV
jgi:O-antigen/teichoic acid export membrane protein